VLIVVLFFWMLQAAPQAALAQATDDDKPAPRWMAKTAPAAVADYAVLLAAVPQKSPPAIKLVWVADPTATEYTVFRKTRDETDFGKPLATLPGTATNWTDTNVTVGSTFEYRVEKKLKQTFNGQEVEFSGWGILYAGLETPLVDYRGRVVLLVDRTHSEALATEISRLQDDLVGDGWQVLRHDVSPDDPVPAVKAMIVKDYQADPKNTQAVFLLGHIPVPYSGDITIHHKGMYDGAWPADVYYGSIAGQWTDTEVNDTKGGEKSHHNVPGDGKFDQSRPTAPEELMVGRVDAWGLTRGEKPKMHCYPIEEKELLRRYLDKDHRWRHAEVKAQSRAMFYNGFPGLVRDYLADAYRTFNACMGAENITVGPWLPTLAPGQQRQPYLWAWGLGGSGNIHVNYANANVAAVFTEVRGSSIGDWINYPDLRSAIFSKSHTLSCDWGAGTFHHMALGEPLGFAIRLYQRQPDYYAFTTLMGDPTLRLHPVETVTDLAITQGGELTWKAPSEVKGLVGYHVYRAAEKSGPYARMTAEPVRETRFSDTKPEAKSWYMVRTVTLQTSPAGSYFNAAQGVFVQAP
jgi:hypothetical protein